MNKTKNKNIKICLIIKKIKRYRQYYIIILPGFIAITLFAYVPLYGLWMAFSNFKLGKPILAAEFVGFHHFERFIGKSGHMLPLLRNTIAMNMISLFFTLLLAMLLAIFLNECRALKFKKIVQTSSFFPFFISWVIVYNVFAMFLSVDNGLLNIIIKDLGIKDLGINFLGDSKYSWSVIAASNIWKTMGYNAVIFLATITGISQTLYESADIDGADRIQKLWFITLPSLSTTLLVLLILNIGWMFNSNFDQYFLFTNSMNRSRMEVFDMFVYRMGLGQLHFSYATAAGMLKSLASIIVVMIANYTSKKFTGKGIF